MIFFTSIYFKDIAIILLLVALFLSTLKIKQLKKHLKEEKQKRTLPLLNLEIDSQETAAYLVNESYCYAKQIRVEDLNIIVECGFKKQLLLKFEPIDMIKPNKRAQLNFHVFDGEYDITSAESPNLIYQFKNSNLRIRLKYCNIEDQPFEAVIQEEKENFYVKEAHPAS